MKLEKTKNAKRNIIWGSISKIVLLLLPFITRTILINKLGSDYLGLNTLFTSILSVLSLAELGFSEAVVFHMYDPIAKEDNKTINAILKMLNKVYFVVGVVILVLGIAIMPFLKYLIKGDIPSDVNLYILFTIFLANNAVSYFGLSYRTSLFPAHQRNDIINKIQTIVTSFMNVIQIIVLLCFQNYYLYIIFLPIGTLITYIILFNIAKRKYPEYYPDGALSTEQVSSIKKNIKGIVLHKLGGVLSNSADSIIISAILGLTVLAMYSNYFYVITVLSGFYVVITDGIMGGVGNSLATESREKNYSDLIKFSFMGCCIVSWCTVCLCSLYQPFMLIWVGDSLMFNTATMLLFGLYFYVMRFDSIGGVYKSALGVWNEDCFRPIISGLLNLSLNIILALILNTYAPEYSVIGILLSSIICKLFIDYPWGSIVTFRKMGGGMKKYTLFLVFYSIVTLVSIVVTYLLCDLIPMEREILGIWYFVLRLGICVIVPNVIFTLFYFKLKAFKDSKNFILSHLKRN